MNRHAVVLVVLRLSTMRARAKLQKAKIAEPSDDASPATQSSRLHLHTLPPDLLAAIIEYISTATFANLLLASKTTHSLLEYAFPSKVIFPGSSKVTRTQLIRFCGYMNAALKIRGSRLRELIVEGCIASFARENSQEALSNYESNNAILRANILKILQHTPNLRVLELHSTEDYFDVTHGPPSHIPVPLFSGLHNLSVLRLDDCQWIALSDAFQGCTAPLQEVTTSMSDNVDGLAALEPVAAHLRSVGLTLHGTVEGSGAQPPRYIFNNVKNLSLGTTDSTYLKLSFHAAQFPNISHLFIHCSTQRHGVLHQLPLGSWPLLRVVEGDWLSVDALSLPASLCKIRLYPPTPDRRSFGQPLPKVQRLEDILARVLRKALQAVLLNIRFDGMPKGEAWSALYEMKSLRTLQVVCMDMWAGKGIENFLVKFIIYRSLRQALNFSVCFY